MEIIYTCVHPLVAILQVRKDLFQFSLNFQVPTQIGIHGQAHLKPPFVVPKKIHVHPQGFVGSVKTQQIARFLKLVPCDIFFDKCRLYPNRNLTNFQTMNCFGPKSAQFFFDPAIFHLAGYSVLLERGLFKSILAIRAKTRVKLEAMLLPRSVNSRDISKASSTVQ